MWIYILDVVYDLYLVGGYKDDAGKAQKISQRFFKHLHELTIRLAIISLPVETYPQLSLIVKSFVYLHTYG